MKLQRGESITRETVYRELHPEEQLQGGKD